LEITRRAWRKGPACGSQAQSIAVIWKGKDIGERDGRSEFISEDADDAASKSENSGHE